MHSITTFLIIASLVSVSVSKPTYHDVPADNYGNNGRSPYDEPLGYDGDNYGSKDNYGDNYGDNYDDNYGSKDNHGSKGNYGDNYGDDDDYYGGNDDYYGGNDYGAKDNYGGEDDYSAMPKKPCKKPCDCAKTPVYEMDAACHKKCIKPTQATKPCTTPTPVPTKPCTTSVIPKAMPTHAGTSPVGETRPVCKPITVTKTVESTKIDYKTVTATKTVVHTSVVTSVKIVPTTVVKHKTVTVDHTVTSTCTQTSTVHDVKYKTVTKESTKTVTVGAKPTEESKPHCHECEAAKSDYGESKPYAGAVANNAYQPTKSSDYPTIPTGYAGNNSNAH